MSRSEEEVVVKEVAHGRGMVDLHFDGGEVR
jgi:hypothetical protein